MIRIMAGITVVMVLTLLTPILLIGVAAMAVPIALAQMVAITPAAVPTVPPVGVGDVPRSLTAVTRSGTTITLSSRQLSRAATIIQVARDTTGVGRRGATVALMAALTESSLRMLSNTSAYPATADDPNDGDGSDHDSLGLFQMRPSTGWGPVANLMDATYQARAFFGGPTGPNHGAPRGLLDIPRWQSLSEGSAAQAVEVSAFPDRYADFQPVAEAIVRSLTTEPGARLPATGG